MENMETVITRRHPQREETPELIPGYFARIDKGDLLTHEEEIDLSERAKAGDKRARQRLIEKNLRLVVSVAKKYRGCSCLKIESASTVPQVASRARSPPERASHRRLLSGSILASGSSYRGICPLMRAALDSLRRKYLCCEVDRNHFLVHMEEELDDEALLVFAFEVTTTPTI